MLVIYSDSPVIDREWIPNIRFNSPYQIVHSLEKYQQTPADNRVAFTAHRLHVEHDTELQFEIKILKLSEISDLVFAIESEIHQFHWSIWAQCHRDNVYWMHPGTVNDRDDMRKHIIPWQDWFKTTRDLYRELPDILSRLSPYNIKQKYFDALLGSPKQIGRAHV